MIEYLLKEERLQATAQSHPKANVLISSLPTGWPKQNWRQSSWYTTPGFGTQHIEIADLYLLVIDSVTGDALVLHENHF